VARLFGFAQAAMLQSTENEEQRATLRVTL
jgi:hypothetical protein